MLQNLKVYRSIVPSPKNIAKRLKRKGDWPVDV
jgi:hypothetical protein